MNIWDVTTKDGRCFAVVGTSEEAEALAEDVGRMGFRVATVAIRKPLRERVVRARVAHASRAAVVLRLEDGTRLTLPPDRAPRAVELEEGSAVCHTNHDRSQFWYFRRICPDPAESP